MQFQSKGAADADRFVGVICKPFKTEYEHEYGGGRLKKDPRTEEDGKWFVPSIEDVQNVRKSIFYKRKNNRISGVGLNETKSNMSSSRQGFRRTSSSYIPIQNSNVYTKTPNQNSSIMLKKAHFKKTLDVFPYSKYSFEESLPLNENLVLSSCNTMKAQPYIGREGGGKKSIRIFSGFMGERPTASKNILNSNRMAGKGTGV